MGLGREWGGGTGGCAFRQAMGIEIYDSRVGDQGYEEHGGVTL